jgi:hypothetical protein
MKPNFKREASACIPHTGCGLSWLLWILQFVTLPAFSQSFLDCAVLNNDVSPRTDGYQLLCVEGPRGYIQSFSFIARYKGAAPGLAPIVHVRAYTDLAALGSVDLGLMRTPPIFDCDYATNTLGFAPMTMAPLGNTDCFPAYLFTMPIRTNSSVGTWFSFWFMTKDWVIPPLKRPGGAGLHVFQACRYSCGTNPTNKCYYFKPLPAVNNYYAPYYTFDQRPILKASYAQQALTLSWEGGFSNLWLTSRTERIPVTGTNYVVPITNASELFWLEQ